jgi:phosphatidylinositol alpha-1,6-mannosyltransferase
VDHVRFIPGDREAAKAEFGVSGKIVVTTVARVHQFKGHDVVLRALAEQPLAARARYVYLVAGRGPDVDRLRRLASDLGITEHVRWLGYVPEHRLALLYRATDLFALCTREQAHRQEVEGFGLVFLEAQACGTPVVGTRSGGIPDAVAHGDGGWLIDSDDHTALASLLARALHEPAWLEDARVHARARVERDWTWEQFLGRFQAALSERGLDAT